jgi:hypothetical protein
LYVEFRVSLPRESKSVYHQDLEVFLITLYQLWTRILSLELIPFLIIFLENRIWKFIFLMVILKRIHPDNGICVQLCCSKNSVFGRKLIEISLIKGD